MTGLSRETIERVQEYLTAFGYLESPVLDTFGISRTKAAAPPAQRGTFDQHTAQALKRFQEFHHLPFTDAPDDALLDFIARPRCGFPDTADYVLDGRKWHKTALTYGFRELTTDLPASHVHRTMVRAFRLWAAVTPLTFTNVPLGSKPDIVIRFVTGEHGDGNPFTGPGGVLAHAFYPPPNGGALAGDLHFDENESWSVSLPPNGIDLVTVAAHEIGHALGLAHSGVTGALMYPYYDGPHRSLHDDDVAGIQTLYGAR